MRPEGSGRRRRPCATPQIAGFLSVRLLTLIAEFGMVSRPSLRVVWALPHGAAPRPPSGREGTADGQLRTPSDQPHGRLARVALDAHLAAQRPRRARPAARSHAPRQSRLTRLNPSLALLYCECRCRSTSTAARTGTPSR